MNVKLIAHTPKPLYVCAEAAAACYNSSPDLKIIKGCIRSGHESVLEHCSFTFKIENCSRSASHQLVRHRIASYSQQSQRYVAYDSIDWVIDGIDNNAIEPIMLSCADSLIAYKDMLNKGIKPEDARAVLPNATPTTIYVTFNLRALMHFCNERMCSRAQKEIHMIAIGMKKAIISAEDISVEEKEILKKVLVSKCEKNSICPEAKGCGKYPSIKDLTILNKGKWIAHFYDQSNNRDDYERPYECSICGYRHGFPCSIYKFCPNCGAKMGEINE